MPTERDTVLNEYLDEEYDQHTGRVLLSSKNGITKGEAQRHINATEDGSYNVGPIAANLAVAADADETDVAVTLAATDADGTVASWVIVTVPESGEGTVDVGGSALTDAAAVTLVEAESFVYNAPSTPGEYTFTYAAVDNDGKQGEAATVTVTVTAAE